MINLNLQEGEGILLQTDCVGKYTEEKELEIDELYLTNKNIIQVYEFSTGLFSKSKTTIEKLSLTDIRVVNGKPQVSTVDDVEYGITLQLILNNGCRILFDLNGSPKKIFPQWEKTITEAVINLGPIKKEESSKKQNENNNLNDDIKEENNSKYEANDNVKKEKTIRFCSYCGGELDKGAKFCKHCGSEVNVVTSNKSHERHTFYDGKVAKCPQCGEVLNSFVSTCPSCGYEIRGRERVSVVHELSLKIEKTNDDKKKDELIRNFYIPNTKEDIYEFFILAVSNINADDYCIEAWSAKLDQAYQKAKLAFGNKAEFEQIEQMYVKAKKKSSTKTVNKKIKKSGFIKFVPVIIGFIMIIIGAFTNSLSGMALLPVGLLIVILYFVS